MRRKVVHGGFRRWLPALALALAWTPIISAGEIDPEAVDIAQINFRGGRFSNVGEITIDLDAGPLEGVTVETRFVNVVNPLNDEWLVRNLPLFGTYTPYDRPDVTTRLDLTYFLDASTDGDLSDEVVELIIDLHPEPSPTLLDVLGHGTMPAPYPVGMVLNAVGGVGMSDVFGPGAPPDLTDVDFNGGPGIQPAVFVFQPGHPNVQAGYNQCAPCAVANSLQFLENTTPLVIPHPNVPGFGADGSLVGQLDVLTGRTLGPDRRSLLSSGVWPMDGKLAYIAANGLTRNIQVKHRVNGFANNSGTPLTGNTDYTHMGVTSTGAGAAFDINWIITELEDGEDVEIDLFYQGPNDGRHYVDVVGAGYIAGMPFLLHVSDKVQADIDPLDNMGTTGVDFEWIVNATGLAANSNAIIDQVVSESWKESTDLPCEEFDRFLDLTALDTVTLVTIGHNPQQEQGYFYVFAVDGSDEPIAFDWLIGNLLVVNGLDAFQYGVNPIDYGAQVRQGNPTDLDGDGVRDLNGLEYARTAGELLVPRFLGQSDRAVGELVLIGLSGGSQFDTTAGFYVYNDDEDQYSAQLTFRCWEKVHLEEISEVFDNDWLTEFSGQNPLEGLGAEQEYGWFRIYGENAHSSFFDIIDPAIQAVYIETVNGTAAADLPFETCVQSGHLLPRLESGDNEETMPPVPDQDCAVSPDAREPASLLLYPEFDNRAGIVSVVTVTNTNEFDATRVHFIYVGRYGNP